MYDIREHFLKHVNLPDVMTLFLQVTAGVMTLFVQVNVEVIVLQQFTEWLLQLLDHTGTSGEDWEKISRFS